MLSRTCGSSKSTCRTTSGKASRSCASPRTAFAFCRSIVKTAVLYRPSRVLGLALGAVVRVAVALVRRAGGRLGEDGDLSRRRAEAWRLLPAACCSWPRRSCCVPAYLDGAHRGGRAGSPVTNKGYDVRLLRSGVGPAIVLGDSDRAFGRWACSPGWSGEAGDGGGGRGLFTMVVLGVTRGARRGHSAARSVHRHRGGPSHLRAAPRPRTGDQLRRALRARQLVRRDAAARHRSRGESKTFFMMAGRVARTSRRLGGEVPHGSSRCSTSPVGWVTRPRLSLTRSRRQGDGRRCCDGAVTKRSFASPTTASSSRLLDEVADERQFDLCYVNGAYHHIPPWNSALP